MGCCPLLKIMWTLLSVRKVPAKLVKRGREGRRERGSERERWGGRDGRNIHYHAYGGDLFYH